MVRCTDCEMELDLEVDRYCPGCGAVAPHPRVIRVDTRLRDELAKVTASRDIDDLEMEYAFGGKKSGVSARKQERKPVVPAPVEDDVEIADDEVADEAEDLEIDAETEVDDADVLVEDDDEIEFEDDEEEEEEVEAFLEDDDDADVTVESPDDDGEDENELAAEIVEEEDEPEDVDLDGLLQDDDVEELDDASATAEEDDEADEDLEDFDADEEIAASLDVEVLEDLDEDLDEDEDDDEVDRLDEIDVVLDEGAPEPSHEPETGSAPAAAREPAPEPASRRVVPMAPHLQEAAVTTGPVVVHAVVRPAASTATIEAPPAVAASIDAEERDEERRPRRWLWSIPLAVLIVVGVLVGNAFREREPAAGPPYTARSADGSLSFRVPGNWRVESSAEGTFQIGYRWHDAHVYATVIKKASLDRDRSLEKHSARVRREFQKSLDNVEVSAPTKTKVQGRNAIRAEFSGESVGESVEYIHTVVESKKDYVQVVAWVPEKWFATDRAVLLEIVDSLKIDDK